MKPKDWDPIATALVLAVAALAAIAAGLWLDNRTQSKPESQDRAFSVESGPQIVGCKELYVVRHLETGRRFVLVMGDGPVAVTPLDGVVFEFKLGPAHGYTQSLLFTNWLIDPVYTSQYITNLNQ